MNNRIIIVSLLASMVTPLLSSSNIAISGQIEEKAAPPLSQQPPRQQTKNQAQPHRPSSGSYSSEQIAKVAEILSKYSPASLTAADAKAINNTFRLAGIRRGPGQSEAIRAAGFDPEKIRTLDPPPERGPQPRHQR